MVKYEWDESNGVSVPTNKLMVIDADEYYVGMPLKKVDAETVAPTDGDPEYICLAQRNAGDEIRPLQIPVQEVFPDAVYTKIMEDGTEEKVKFGGGGGGKIKPEQLPDGYPYEKEGLVEIIPEQTFASEYLDYLGGSTGEIISDLDTLEEGSKYAVYFDGVKYDMVCFVVKQTEPAEITSYALKEERFIDSGMGMFGDGEKFYLGFSHINGMVQKIIYINETEGKEHTLAAYKEETIVIPMAEKFLPMLAVAIVYDGSSYTCNKTYDEVVNALNNNIPIYAIYAEYANERRRQYPYREVRQGSNGRIMFVGNAYDVDLDLYPNNEVRPEEMES